MSSDERSPVLQPSGMSRSGSIVGERSRSRVNLKKDISMDEGDALKKISEEADKKLKDEKRKTDEARKYLSQKRHQEQAKFSDEETEVAPAQSTAANRPEATSTPVANRKGDSDNLIVPRIGNTNTQHYSSSFDEDQNSQWQEKYNDIEGKYKEAMISQAKLFDEKTALVYQVESLKDELEDHYQEIEHLKAELHTHQSKVLHAKHTEEVLNSDIDKLKNHIQYRDDFMETHGLHLPTITEEEEEDVHEVKFFPLTEREELMKEISDLKTQIEEAKNSVPTPSSDSLLRGEETKDIIRESTRLVSEYKNKLQIADSETTRLQSMVERLKGQVSRYKSQMEDLEKREDELLKEKRSQSREVRRLQSLLDDIESENELLKRRVEQMRKRQKD